MKKFYCLLMSTLLFLSLSSTVFALGTCTEEHFIYLGTAHCTGNNVNVRTGPGTNYASLGQANKGDIYYMYQTMSEATDGVNRDGLWTHVHGDHIGWMYTQYLSVDEAARSLVVIEIA